MALIFWAVLVCEGGVLELHLVAALLPCSMCYAAATPVCGGIFWGVFGKCLLGCLDVQLHFESVLALLKLLANFQVIL